MLGIRQRNDWVYYALFKYFWILVILPKAVQLLALGALMCLIWCKSGREKSLDKFTLLQLFFALIYGVSILVNAIAGAHAFSRIAASINTWTITVIAISLYHLYLHAQLDLMRLGKYCLFDLLILVLWWLIYKLTEGSVSLSILGHGLAGEDWVNGICTSRFLGYLDYANLVVFCVLFFYPLAVICLDRHKLCALALTVVLFPVINATNSRTGLVLYFLLFLAYFLFELQKSFFTFYTKRKYALFAITILAAAAVVAVGLNQIVNVLSRFMSMREGSNSMRMTIYATSLETMWKKSPFIGIGIKDMIGAYPLGSHSTYVGVFYKAGILGGTLYIISMFYVGLKVILGKDRSNHMITMKICLAAVLLLMSLEDIDGANWCVCIFYILLALLQSQKTVIIRMAKWKLRSRSA